MTLRKRRSLSGGQDFYSGENMLTIRLRTWLAGYRQAHEHRFYRDHDWLRLSVLGCVLLTFSTLALADALATRPLLGDVPGGSAMLIGATIILFTLKIARAEMYGDWILNGVLYVGIGVALSVDEASGHASPSILFCLLLMVSGATRIWIGLTTGPQAVAMWLWPSGCVAVVGGIGAFAAWILAAPITPLSVFAADSLFQGISIAGFSASLRDARAASVADESRSP
jgi:uncharacterized membrane protein HdeD (DUF308 family)